MKISKIFSIVLTLCFLSFLVQAASINSKITISEPAKVEDGKAYIISSMERPTIFEVMKDLEHTYFKPGTLANDQFEVGIMIWETLPYIMVVFPRSHLNHAVNIAKKYKHVLSNGIPTIMSMKKDKIKKTFFNGIVFDHDKEFPKNVFTYESN